MRDQYAGDVSDYLKFAFLRSITSACQTLGIGWYYCDGHDGRPDGRHREYLADHDWGSLDSELHSKLSAVMSVRDLEQCGLWCGDRVFHGVPIPVSQRRANWAEGMYETLRGADVVFVDPDNGLSQDDDGSRKHARLTEIEALAARDRTVVLIRFPHRNTKHAEQLVRHHALLSAFRPMTVLTTIAVPGKQPGRYQPRFRWFTVLNGTAEIGQRTELFARRVAEMPRTRASVCVG